jgi:ribosome maturation factor RimP
MKVLVTCNSFTNNKLNLKIIEEIISLTEPIAEAHDVVVIDVETRGERGSKVVEIFIDNVKGITTAICSEISREISDALDKGDLMKGKYYLNVSSPGLDRPLKFLKQYYKHIGRFVVLRCKKQDAAEDIEAELKDIKENKIVLKTKSDKIYEINFDDIIEAKVKPPW